MPASRSQGKKPAAKAPSSRAKSGCYTCRIRRKKCDEKQDEHGSCESCVRLKIQCLGFGAKRPDWLRESSRVMDLREKIKAHLASQGMIKGHSGSGPRNVDNEQTILKLSYDDYSSATDSPTTPSLSLSSNEDPKASPSQPSWVILGEEYPGNSSGLMPSHTVELEETTPYPSSQHYSDHLISYSDMTAPHTLTSAPSNWNNIVATRGPSTHSSFSATYHQHYEDVQPYEINTISPQSSIFYTPPDPLLVHYTTHVIPIEYLLADKRTINVLIQAMGAYGAAGEAARLLSTVHQYRSNSTSHNRRALEHPDVASRYNSLTSIFYKRSLEEDDAFAALQVVSAFLFDGGTGSWQDWLKIACTYCGSILRSSRYTSAAHALMSVNETTRFIIQTSMWFDVLASVTLGDQPHFLAEFRELYDPNSAHIEDQGLSMLNVMGCENLTVWALSEISTLSKWKADEDAQGRLSVPRLVERARNIELHLDTAPIPSLEGRNEVDSCRILACRIFRASAKVYLHSVVSGNRPQVPEISNAVTETIRIINQVPETGSSGVSRSVMRSTVFGLFICGALTDDLVQQDTILKRLLNQHSSETVGNTSSVTTLLRDIWANRQRRNQPEEEVFWREALKESRILLV